LTGGGLDTLQHLAEYGSLAERLHAAVLQTSS
jgi:hypothetical protein